MRDPLGGGRGIRDISEIDSTQLIYLAHYIAGISNRFLHHGERYHGIQLQVA